MPIAAARLATAKILLIQYGPTMTVEQFRDAFFPKLMKRSIENRSQRGEAPRIRNGVMDSQEIGEWWDAQCSERVS